MKALKYASLLHFTDTKWTNVFVVAILLCLYYGQRITEIISVDYLMYIIGIIATAYNVQIFHLNYRHYQDTFDHGFQSTFSFGRVWRAAQKASHDWWWRASATMAFIMVHRYAYPEGLIPNLFRMIFCSVLLWLMISDWIRYYKEGGTE